jgi:glutathione-independent formaldehyde dehydrogenase
MRAVVYKGPFKVDVEQVPDPRIEHPSDAIIKITSSCICGSDLHMYEGRTLQYGSSSESQGQGDCVSLW